ncbi:[citrate (pro-3S)-lyase] ligase [Furfurilactobacillus siliginis]|uniref:[Citrate [pro-3S]-lyase] ligase n=1 Tax=Furfurilactobacillus siliginis TaxID=348151 RepID=A0A0R2LBS2_9LACO|nr:[citrate (pro-3S)-lyase] ligase [Furfurilactobacillus siliginis]KRN97237.1 [citrate (pro-3S)-lyase] ligase [Furfurilactobacillus siliginis]GEK29457.1 [Citrate [pro-3S]-lyase] ligase [Furfurilactobacillus siliginis]
MDNEIVDLHLRDRHERKQWESFLTDLGITDFSTQETAAIDFTLGIYEGDRLVATGSAAGNVLKYIAVCNKDTTNGARFNAIVSALINRLFQQQIFHLFVFTKLKYSDSFQHVGFHELAHSDVAALLETGDEGIDDYLQAIPRVADQDTKQVAGIVMNANPFTKGHRYLVETAAKANDVVYVFVVNTDASLFTTAERFELVQAGTADLDNVIVVNGGDYMVSFATFPAYFLPTADQQVTYQTTLDARIFRERIAPALNITARYLGTEPLSRTTGIYNQVLTKELPPAVNVTIVDRKQTDTGTFITATAVRKAIAEDQLDSLADLLPVSTVTFIKDHLSTLRARIQKGMNINGN